MNQSRNIISVGSLLFLLTLVSRILGLIRDILIAWCIGSGPLADIVACALRIPHVLRRLLHEGALSLTFTRFLVACEGNFPREEHCLPCAEGSDFQALCFSRLSQRVFLFLLAITVLFAVFSPTVAFLLAPSFSHIQQETLATLLRIAAPYILCSGMSALAMACLHARHIFWVSASGPILLNVCMLFFLAIGFFFRDLAPSLLLAGFCLGGILQWFVQVFFLAKTRFGAHRREKPARRGKPLDGDLALGETVKKRISACLWEIPRGVFAASAQQCAFLIGMIFLSGWGHGQVAGQFYAERILELPVSLISVCLGMASLPVLSHLADRKNYVRFARQLTVALHWALFLIAPALFGILAVGYEFIILAFGHGNFTDQGVTQTWMILRCYLIGLPACAVSRILLSGCVALQGTNVACGATVVTLVLTTVLCCTGLFPPVSVSLALWMQVLLLGVWLGKTLRFYTRSVFFSVGRLLRCTLAALLACFLAHIFLMFTIEALNSRFLALLLSIVLAVVVWIVLLKKVSYRDFQHIARLFDTLKKKCHS